MSGLARIQHERQFDTDKGADYLNFYDHYCNVLRYQPITLLEIGVKRGGSLLLWREYFKDGRIFGLDLAPQVEIPDSAIRCFQCDQGDRNKLSAIAEEIGPLDIVIDDAAHTGALATASFSVLFPHLKSGGWYVLEDWGTGYWREWPDGEVPYTGELPVELEGRFPSHEAGMVGLLKQLVDECAASDRYHSRNGLVLPREPVIKSVLIRAGVAMIEKV